MSTLRSVYNAESDMDYYDQFEVADWYPVTPKPTPYPGTQHGDGCSCEFCRKHGAQADAITLSICRCLECTAFMRRSQ